MSSPQPSPTSASEPAGSTPAGDDSSARTAPSQATPQRDRDPLRGSRTSGIWVAVVALIVVLILLAVFILQNTQSAEVNFLGWSGSAPVSATLLIAAAGGALIVAAAGMLRILQLRRRVKQVRKQQR